MILIIKKALENAIVDGCILQSVFEDYMYIFSHDKRYKVKWLAADCYKKGCSSGIIRYMDCEYYFSLSGSAVTVQLR